MSRMNSTGGLVYSTEHGRTCPVCRQPLAACSCKQNSVPKGDGVVRVSRETKGRGGKCVSVVKGVLLAAPELNELAKKLKTACGTGGTAKDGVIEIQGDHCELIVTKLKALGFTVKRAGG